MQSDYNKGITKIQYNSLNLPLSIAMDNVSVKGQVNYTYSASGEKLSTVHRTDPDLQRSPVMAVSPYTTAATITKTTDYVGNKIYEDGTLKRILIDGGYIESNVYHFYLTDHLGNNRVVADATGKAVQTTHYYPFGMAFSEGTVQEQGKQPYKYNGKELDAMHGLNMYDYHARQMDPAIGRFTMVDPMAEKYYNTSPYVYVDNNPLKFIDPDGKQIGFPPGNYMGVNWQQAAMQQKTEKLAVYAAQPSAISISAGRQVGEGISFKQTYTATLFLRGENDAGRLRIYESVMVGVGTAEISGSLGMSMTHSSRVNRDVCRRWRKSSRCRSIYLKGKN